MQESKGSILIRGGRVLTLDGKSGAAEKADVFIRDGIIKHIGPAPEAHDAEVIEARDTIVMPGFVDCHRHMWQTQLRAITADWSLFDYSSRIRSVYTSFYEAGDAYLGTYAGYLEAINAGVTTIVDHSHIMNTPDHADEVVRATLESGIRAILCYGMYGNARPDQVLTPAVLMSPDWHYDDAKRLKVRYFNADDGRVTMGIALTEAEFFPIELSRKELAFARSLGSKRISAHVGMGGMSKNTRYIERLNKAGLMGEDILFIHGWNLTDSEMRICAQYKAAVINTPETELQMGMGYPVSWRALSAGGRSGLGIDIVSNQSADMFTQMRLNIQVQRALQNDKLIRAGMMPRVLSPTVRQVLELATIRGAESIGLSSCTGSITVGKQADIILVRADSVNMFPVNDPVNAIVLSANVGDIDTVIVGGKILKRAGKLVGVDLSRLREKLEKSRDKIIEGGRKKGFAGGEALMSNVFPLDRKLAFGVWLAAMIVRSEIKPLQDWFLEKIAGSTR